MTKTLSAIAAFVFPILVAAQSSTDWDPATKIPEFRIVGPASAHDLQDAQTLRTNLISFLDYWRKIGLPNIPAVDAMIFIPTYADQSIRDYLQVLNPDIPDIGAHVKAQYLAFQHSKIAAAIMVYSEVVGASPVRMVNQFFDTYAGLRYGYTGEGFLEDLEANKSLARLFAERDLIKDNAYVSRSTRVNLSDVLEPFAGDRMTIDQAEEILGNKGILALATRLTKAETTRVVVVPRGGQEYFGSNVSTMKDLSVPAHEVSHHISGATTGPHKNDLMIEEAIADYLAAVGLKDSRIGSFFAAVSSGAIQQLVAGVAEGQISLDRAKELSQLVLAKSMLRSMETTATLDTIPRVLSYQESHDAGDPVRRFLWQVRSQLPGREAEFDRIVLAANVKNAELPVAISNQTDALLNFRRKVMEIRRFVKEFHESMKAKIRFDRELKFSERAFISQQVSQQDAALESRRAKLRSILRPFGLAFRPKVPADYVIPEFFRTFYRESAGQPEIQSIIRAEAEKAMNSASFEVQLSNGVRELVFARNRISALNPIAHQRATVLLERRQRLLSEYLAGDIYEPRKGLMEEYGKSIQGLQEYERTGRLYRLFWPYPTISIASAWFGYTGNSKPMVPIPLEEAGAHPEAFRARCKDAMTSKVK